MKLRECVNSRLGESVSDLHTAKIRLGKFKAVYCTVSIHNFTQKLHQRYKLPYNRLIGKI